MKKLLFILISLLIFSVASAQSQWADDGVPIRTGKNIEWFRSAIPIEDGSVVYVWSDTRNGDRDIFAQKVTETGEMLWGANSEDPEHPGMMEGVLVNDAINRQEDPVIIDAGDNNVIIAWVDFRNEDAGDIYAQKLNADGELLWATEGVPLCLATGIQISLNIANDTEGGAYIIWLDSRGTGGTDIYGTHILSNGDIAAGWDSDGNAIIVEAGTQNQHTFWEDGAGGAIVVWHDTRNPTNENIYMQRISSDGTLLWDANGSALCDAEGTQIKPKITPLTDGDFMVTWRDERIDYNGDIYARKIDLDGNLLWDNDLIVFEDANIQENPRITRSSDGGAFITWQDGRYDINFKEIFIQKVSSEGAILWDPNGVTVCDEAYDQLNPRLVGDAEGGTFIIWDDGREGGHPNENIYIQHYNSDASFNFPEDGYLVCDEFREQFAPLVKKNVNGKYFINWGDYRTGSVGMYIQIVDTDDTLLLAEDGEILYYGLNGDAQEYKLIENGDNALVIWVDTRFSSIAKRIYMQILNDDGTVELETNGLPVTVMSGYNQENIDVAYYPGSNLIPMVWEENRIGDKQIFAQAVDLDVDFIWSEDFGIQLCQNTASQEYPAISLLQTGGNFDYYAGWSDNRDWLTGYGIYGQRISADGTLNWGDEGILIADGGGDDVLNDIVEDFYIWHGGSWPAQDLYAKRVNADGSTADGWPEEGLNICCAIGFQEKARGIIVPEGLLVIWEDKRSGSSDIYGQLISYDGTILWAHGGVPICSAPEDQREAVFLYDENLYVTWEDFRNGNDEDIFMQKFDADGNGVWHPNGNEVAAKDSAQFAASMVKNGDNFIVFWQDNQTSSGSDLYAQLLDMNGDILWEDEGYVVSDAIKNQNKPVGVPTGTNMAFVVWEDTRSSGKTDIYNLYGQKLRIDNSDSDDDIIPSSSITLKQNYPNPFNPETTISFSITKGDYSDYQLKIFNIKGQLVNSLPVETNKVTWKGRDLNQNLVSNGIYFYKLVSDDESSATRKMLLLK
jgi:type IX secretion system substrate protein